MKQETVSKVMSQLAKDGWKKRKLDKKKMKFYKEILPGLGRSARKRSRTKTRSSKAP